MKNYKWIKSAMILGLSFFISVLLVKPKGFSSILLPIAYWIGIFDINHLSIKTLNLGIILGGIIFGLGFGYAGTCPGICVGASGTDNFKKRISAILGGLTDALAFTISYGYLNNIGLISGFDLDKQISN